MALESDLPEFLRNKSEEERSILEMKLKRKIDTRLMPMIVIMYIMNNLDRNNIAAARLAGLPEDLGLKGTEYQLTVSVLFVGYLLMQVPSNLYLNEIGKPAIYLPACMLVWGLISTCMAASQSFIGLLICRLALGFAEAAYFPGCLFYLSCWYTREELSFRTAIFFSGSLISGAISGLVTSGINAHLDGARGIRAWRWLFIIEGLATITIAAMSFIILPNFPSTTSWLSIEEREIASWRVIEDNGGNESSHDNKKKSFLHGLKLALMDIKTYVLMVLVFSIVASGTVANFFPTIVKTLNYNKVTTLLLTSPPFGLALLATCLNSWHSDHTKDRFFHIVAPLFVAFSSFIIAIVANGIGLRYFAMNIMLPSVFSSYVIALSWISTSLPQPRAKRAAALALISSVANTTHIFTSFLYWDEAAPRYLAAMSFNCGVTLTGIFSAIAMRMILMRLNRQLNKGDYGHIPIKDASLLRHSNFRYII